MGNAYELASVLTKSAKEERDEVVSAYDQMPSLEGYCYPLKSLDFASIQEVDRGEAGWWIGESIKAGYRLFGAFVDAFTDQVAFVALGWSLSLDEAKSRADTEGFTMIWDMEFGGFINVELY